MDAANVYWTNYAAGNAGSGTVRKVPLNGGSVTTLASGRTGPLGIATDGVNVYWVDLLGSPFAIASNQNGPTGIALSSTTVYFTTNGTAEAGYTNGAVMAVTKP